MRLRLNMNPRDGLSQLMVLAALAIMGCGGSSSPHPMATVRGKVVTPAGTPLTEGMVNFDSPELGVGASQAVEQDGTFKLPAEIRAGKYTVTITPPPPPPPEPTAKPMPLDLSRFQETIPMKYRTTKTSEFKGMQINSGKNDLTLEMKK